VLEYIVKPVPDLSSQVDLESYLNDELTDSYTCKCKNKEILNIEFSPIDEFSKDRFEIFKQNLKKICATKFEIEKALSISSDGRHNYFQWKWDPSNGIYWFFSDSSEKTSCHQHQAYNNRFQKVHISEPLTLSFSEAINYCDNMGLQLPIPDSLFDNKKLMDLGLFSFVRQSERTFICTNECMKTF